MKQIKVNGMPEKAISDEEMISIDIWLPKELNTVCTNLLFCKNRYWLNTENIEFDYKGEEGGYKIFSKTFKFNQYESRPEYVHYCCFEIRDDNGTTKWIKVNENKQPIIDEKKEHWVFTVYKEYEIPSWIKGAIMYQIFVDRFCKDEEFIKDNKTDIEGREYIKWDKLPPKWASENGIFKNNEFYRGNLRGITKKLDYLCSLHVEVLYLTPIMYSKSNHRYDTINYEKIDPDVGTKKDLIELCEEARKRGMHIILDIVLNHTSNEAIYIKTKPEWYLRNERGEFYYWWDFDGMVVLDKGNQELQTYLFGQEGAAGILDQYLDCGIDGFRIDVADELNDYTLAVCKEVLNRRNRETILYGEVWDNAVKKEQELRQRKFLLGKWLTSVMNYPVMDALLRFIRYGDNQYLKNTLEEIYKDYPTPAINSLMNIIGTHDTPRAINILVGEYMQEEYQKGDSVYPHIWDMEVNSPWKYYENGRERFDTQGFRQWEANNDLTLEMYETGKKLLKVLVILQYFLPGVPCIYYGDEVGVTGYKDPFNRKSFPWNLKKDEELLHFYRELGDIKFKNKDVLGEGDFNLIYLENDRMIFERVFGKSKILVAINRTKFSIKNLKIPSEYKRGQYKIIYSLNDSTKNLLNSYGAIILA
ncbi:MAG: glycoside hydrolase family 13 protein [Clostridia bacterium]|nr:glycoside hydrolase family 13 protein [Clostridia bacterium]